MQVNKKVKNLRSNGLILCLQKDWWPLLPISTFPSVYISITKGDIRLGTFSHLSLFGIPIQQWVHIGEVRSQTDFLPMRHDRSLVKVI